MTEVAKLRCPPARPPDRPPDRPTARPSVRVIVTPNDKTRIRRLDKHPKTRQAPED